MEEVIVNGWIVSGRERERNAASVTVERGFRRMPRHEKADSLVSACGENMPQVDTEWAPLEEPGGDGPED